MKKIIILIISLLTLFLTVGGVSLNYIYKSGLEDINNGNYEAALKQLRLVDKFSNNKTIEEKIELAIKEQETLSLLKAFYDRLGKIQEKLDSLEGVVQVDNQAKLLKSTVEKMEETELSSGSKVAILLNEIKQDESYILLRDDYILGNVLDDFKTPSFNLLGAMGETLVLETSIAVIDGAIDEIFKIETMGLIPQ